MAERRRLERDLHDGAQQRLVSLALNLRMARGKLRDDPDTAAALLDGSAAELDRALEELRELARGIHPAVLSDRGLDAALESLAVRAPLPVELTSVLRRAAGRGGVGRLLRGRRGADQRGQVRRRVARPGSRSNA